MNTKLKLFFTLTAVLFSKVIFADANTDNGKKIFTSRCNSCHNVNAQLVGPALAKVDERRSLNWIVNFVHSPKKLIESNDKDAVTLYNQFNQVVMPDHTDLTETDIKALLSYIKSETKAQSANDAPFVKPGKLVPDYLPLSIAKNADFFIMYLAAVFILTALLIFAVSIKDLQRKAREVKTGK